MLSNKHLLLTSLLLPTTIAAASTLNPPNNDYQPLTNEPPYTVHEIKQEKRFLSNTNNDQTLFRKEWETIKNNQSPIDKLSVDNVVTLIVGWIRQTSQAKKLNNDFNLWEISSIHTIHQFLRVPFRPCYYKDWVDDTPVLQLQQPNSSKPVIYASESSKKKILSGNKVNPAVSIFAKECFFGCRVSDGWTVFVTSPPKKSSERGLYLFNHATMEVVDFFKEKLLGNLEHVINIVPIRLSDTLRTNIDCFCFSSYDKRLPCKLLLKVCTIFNDRIAVHTIKKDKVPPVPNNIQITQLDSADSPHTLLFTYKLYTGRTTYKITLPEKFFASLNRPKAK